MTIESLVINFPYTQHSVLVFFKKNRNLYNAIRGITKQHGFVTTTEGTTEIEERNIKKGGCKMQRNIVVRNGHVIDPANQIDGIRDVYISNGRIVAESDMQNIDLEFNADGKYVFPGLIDYHAHVFPNSTEIGIDPDSTLLCQGVTSVVDPGSAGVSNIETFIKDVANRAIMRVEAYINLCPSGMPTMKFHEDFNPKHWDKEKLRQALAKYPDLLQGLKIRISKPIMGDLPFSVFEQAEALAKELDTRLCVHVTNPQKNMAEAVSVLQKGDILAHCYHGTGYSILDENGNVLDAVKEAQKRGVIMDAANGGNHWNFEVAEKALANGFLPDIISTDLTSKTIFKDPVFGLPYIMSKYLMLGMSISDIVKRCTENPGNLMNGKEKPGTLSKGALADVAVFSLEDHVVTFSDTSGAKRTGNKLFRPVLTLCKGEIVYRDMTF